MRFRVELEHLPDATVVVALGGEVDLYTAPELRDRLVAAIDAGARRLVVDMTETTFIDSTTLGVLIGAVKRLRPVDGEVLLVAPDRNIRKVFEITLLDRVFPISDTLEDALTQASAPGA